MLLEYFGSLHVFFGYHVGVLIPGDYLVIDFSPGNERVNTMPALVTARGIKGALIL